MERQTQCAVRTLRAPARAMSLGAIVVSAREVVGALWPPRSLTGVAGNLSRSRAPPAQSYQRPIAVAQPLVGERDRVSANNKDADAPLKHLWRGDAARPPKPRATVY